ncbi:putative zinc-binding metallopeptidase [Propionibacterium sp.]|uniref:zinc-binding metallopeptidase family protein n=1 Tax=Propionibacterium sp. TaxID=1977903 RepID=UPI0039ECB1A6
MRVMKCPQCGYPVWLEDLACQTCGLDVLLDPMSLQMVPFDGGTDTEGRSLVSCANRANGCNWAAPADKADNVGQLCFACRLTRRSPDPDDAPAMRKLAVTSQSIRRLLYGLASAHIPVVPYWVREGGLAFDLLSSQSEGVGKVMIGHANGVITMDLAESLDDYREAQRLSLGEAYRTMLGHFRHEIGHYYEWQLVESVGGPLLDRCRELFGDERASYSEAIERHYREGPPKGWRDSYISEYATMHPWEDFAESFAHYQHILDTLTTVSNGGMHIIPDEELGFLDGEVSPRHDYLDCSFEDVLRDWKWVAHLLNRANHAMGKSDLYPFSIPEPVAEKLAFVHHVVLVSRVDAPFVTS